MLLDGIRRERALAFIEQTLARVLACADGESESYGPGVQGLAGMAVLLTTAAKVLGRPELMGGVERLLVRSSALAAKYRIGPSLSAGLAGICWSYEYIDCLVNDFESADGDDSDEDSDDEPDEDLLQAIDQLPEGLHYDLVSGAVGIANYALLRQKHAAGRVLLARSVEPIRSLLTPQPGGGKLWYSRPEYIGALNRERHAEGCYDLGMAHGSAGGLAVLAAALRAGLEQDGLAEAVRDVATALKANAFPNEAGEGRFGSVVGSGPIARLAWCYGDLGMSFAFAGAGLALHDPSLQTYGEQIAEVETRRPDPLCSIGDAGLCHGAAGAAHQFHLWYLATGRDVFATTALRWFDAVAEVPIHWNIPEEKSDDTKLDYLEGRCGVALAFLSALSDTHYPWDHPLGLLYPAIGTPVPCRR